MKDSNIFKIFDLYRNLSRTLKFASFWITISITVLTVIMGINSNKLSSYTSGVEKSKKYDFTNPFDICKFPCDQIKMAENNYQEIISRVKVPKSNYEIVLDLSGSIDFKYLNTNSFILDIDNKISEFTSDEVDPLSNQLNGVGKLGLVIGYFLNKELLVPHENISGYYYMDSRNSGKRYPFLDNNIDNRKWYDALRDKLGKNITITNSPESYIDSFLIDLVLKKDQHEKKTIIMLSDLQVTRSLIEIENSLKVLPFEKRNSIQLLFLQLPTRFPNTTFNETFTLFDKYLTNVRMIKLNEIEFESFLTKETDLDQINKFPYIHTGDEYQEFLLTFERISHKEKIEVKPILKFKLLDRSFISTENFHPKDSLNIVKLDLGNKKSVDLNDVLMPGDYEIDCSSFIDPNFYMSIDLGFIEIFSLKTKTKTRHNIKIGENLDKNVSWFWLILLTITLSSIVGLVLILIYSIVAFLIVKYIFKSENKSILGIVVSLILPVIIVFFGIKLFSTILFGEEFFIKMIWIYILFSILYGYLYFYDKSDPDYM